MKHIFAFLTLFVAATSAQLRAVVVLTGSSGVRGNVTFTQHNDQVSVDGTIEGLKPGLHGFHVHEKGDLTSGCASTGGHFNPHKKNHGGPKVQDRHVGDLGNIEAGDNGVAHVAITDNIISLQGVNNIIGRGVVVHSDADDLGKGGFADSLTTGHAGSRVACGVIGTLQTENLVSTNKENQSSGATKFTYSLVALTFTLTSLFHLF